MLSEPSAVTPTWRNVPCRSRTSSGPPESPRLMVDLDLRAFRADVRAAVVDRPCPEHVPAAGRVREHGLTGSLQVGGLHLADGRGVGTAPAGGYNAASDARFVRGELDPRAGLRASKPDDCDVVSVVQAEIEGVGKTVAQRRDPSRLRPARSGSRPRRRARRRGCGRHNAPQSGRCRRSMSVPPQRWLTGRFGEAQRHHEPVRAERGVSGRGGWPGQETPPLSRAGPPPERRQVRVACSSRSSSPIPESRPDPRSSCAAERRRR